MKNLQLRLSPPEVSKQLGESLVNTHGLSPAFIDTQTQTGCIMVIEGVETATRIIACVNSCNDLDTEHLLASEVRTVIASVVRQRDEAMALLREVTKNAAKVEHDGYWLQGHEGFNVADFFAKSDDLIARIDAETAQAVQA